MPRLLLLLTAFSLCTGCVQVHYTAGKRTPPATPAGLLHSEERVEGKRGTVILTQRWLPEGGAVKASVVLVHGLKDYGDRYAELAATLARQGFAVFALDLRGHGDSEGDRVWVDEFDDYVADVDALIRTAAWKYKGKKIFLFGHSMGGAIATRLVLKDETKVDGLILSAPALRVPVGGLQQLSARVASVLFPTLAVLELDDTKFTRDLDGLARLRTDPLIFHDKGPARTAGELFWAMEQNREGYRKLDLPLLLLHGERDQITSPEGSRELHGLAASKDKTLETYPNLVHDLLHEPERAEVIADIASWLNARAR